MGLRIQKRINLGKGLGLNISKSGISSSFRNKLGSISSKGYSIKSGIPGLTYRGLFNRSSNKSGCLVILVIITLMSILTSMVVS